VNQDLSTDYQLGCPRDVEACSRRSHVVAFIRRAQKRVPSKQGKVPLTSFVPPRHTKTSSSHGKCCYCRARNIAGLTYCPHDDRYYIPRGKLRRALIAWPGSIGNPALLAFLLFHSLRVRFHACGDFSACRSFTLFFTEFRGRGSRSCFLLRLLFPFYLFSGGLAGFFGFYTSTLCLLFGRLPGSFSFWLDLGAFRLLVSRTLY
jgi:hypothetical protein